jgi:hypothetical protein
MGRRVSNQELGGYTVSSDAGDVWPGVLREWSSSVDGGVASNWSCTYVPDGEQLDNIRNRFSYHPPNGNQKMRYELIRAGAHAFAVLLVSHCPDSRELSLAMTHLQQAMMFANAAIACNETPTNDQATE